MSEFIEVYQKAGDNDTLKSLKAGDQLRKSQCKNINDIDDFIRMLNFDDWELIPAEPVVFSAEEIREKIVNECEYNMESYSFQIELVRKGDRNGQIKERKNLQPLIDAGQKINDRFKETKNYPATDFSDLFDILDNIPPLETTHE